MARNLSYNLTHPQRVRILYKAVLRLHRGLPKELKELGDNYARDEFRRHKNCNAKEAALFMTEWAKYAITLSEQIGLKGKSNDKLGNPIDYEIIENLKDEQIVQLYELMIAAKGNHEDDNQQENLSQNLGDDGKK